MGKIIVEIPTTKSDSFGSRLEDFLEIISKTNHSDKRDLVFDFSNCKFISPFIIGGLSALALNGKENGQKVIIKSNPTISSYLNTIAFPSGFDYSNINLAQIESAFHLFNTKTYFPVISFPTDKENKKSEIREKILSAVNTILRRQLKLEGSLLGGVCYLIDELPKILSIIQLHQMESFLLNIFQQKNIWICVL